MDQIRFTRIGSATDFLDVLQNRFNHVTNLRTMTASRHITLIGGVAAALTGIGKLGKVDLSDFLVPTATILLLLSCCVTVYDAMMRVRAEAVCFAIQDVKELVEGAMWSNRKGVEDPSSFNTQHRRYSFFFRHFGEDFFFFSQILLISALPVIPLGDLLTRESFNYVHSILYFGTFIMLVALWMGSAALYGEYGPRPDWAPIAYDAKDAVLRFLETVEQEGSEERETRHVAPTSE